MKEFLEQMPNGDYRYHKDDGINIGGDWIEIPEGANFKTELYFWKSMDSSEHNWGTGWFGNGDNSIKLKDYLLEKGVDIVWQREKVEVKGEKLDTDAMLADIDVQIATHSQHGHYFKDVRDLSVIDVYQVLKLFNVTDPCLQHIVKKALVAGGRGHKDFERDLKDIHDTSKRALEINNIKH